MKNNVLLWISMLLMLGCGSSSNSPEFMEEASGRYLYNSDEVIEVYFENEELYMKWRGAKKIKPLKVDEDAFYVKEMNQKIRFTHAPEDDNYYLTVLQKENDTVAPPKYKKMKPGVLVPSEYLDRGDFDKAIQGYRTLLEKDSLDPAIEERMFNSYGYRLLRNDSIEKAVTVFRINVALYPNSSNVYDSLGEALLKKGDTVGSLENYRKAYAMDSANSRAERMIERLEKKDD
jgi:tetratricopeptide (TPR) repeat protein